MQGIMNITSRQAMLTNLVFRQKLEYALYKVGILSSSINISAKNNTFILDIKGFTKTYQSTKLRTNLVNFDSAVKLTGKQPFIAPVSNEETTSVKKSNKKIVKSKNLQNSLLRVLRNITKDKNLLIIYTNLNRKVNKVYLKRVYFALRQFIPILFKRGITNFMDLVKLTILFAEKNVSARLFLKLLGVIFKNLTKRQHNKFLLFVLILFKQILKISKKNIHGLKLILNGKIQGKTRSNTKKITCGRPTKTTVRALTIIETIHVYTIYGVFGLQFWVSHNKEDQNKPIIQELDDETEVEN